MNLDANASARALATDAVACRGVRDVITVTGPEAATYLHGQASQDILGLAVGQARFTLVLSPQGRIDGWGRVIRVGDEAFWLDIDAGYGAALLARLERFKLRTKAEFALVEMTMISVRGPRSPEGQAGLGDFIDVPYWWEPGPGFDRLGPDADRVSWPDGAAEGDPEVIEAHRIRCGIPRMGAELGEKTIPAEAGIVDASVDFTKGCYTGQELVARVDSRGGNTPRRIWGVTAEQGLEVGDRVVVEGEDVGHLTSVAMTPTGAVALASIVRSATVPGPAAVSGHPVMVTALPIPA